MANIASAAPDEITGLLRGEPKFLREWLAELKLRRWVICILVTLVGAGLYGAVIGYWRSPIQALFTAIKFPLVLLATTAGNALLNGLLAPLIGLNIGFRQTTLAILMSQAVAAAILASFSPLAAFMVWNLPPMSQSVTQFRAFAFLQVSQVAVIAFAGTAAHINLYRSLKELGRNAKTVRNVMTAWLLGNLLLGTQLTWIFRPFFGAPSLEVQFFRAEALKGNFFETIAHSVSSFFH